MNSRVRNKRFSLQVPKNITQASVANEKDLCYLPDKQYSVSPYDYAGGMILDVRRM